MKDEGCEKFNTTEVELVLRGCDLGELIDDFPSMVDKTVEVEEQTMDLWKYIPNYGYSFRYMEAQNV